jgi:hypothetical protein
VDEQLTLVGLRILHERYAVSAPSKS